MESKGLFSVNDQLLQVIEDTPKLTKEQEQALMAETSKLSISYVRELCKHAAPPFGNTVGTRCTVPAVLAAGENLRETTTRPQSFP